MKNHKNLKKNNEKINEYNRKEFLKNQNIEKILINEFNKKQKELNNFSEYFNNFINN